MVSSLWIRQRGPIVHRTAMERFFFARSIPFFLWDTRLSSLHSSSSGQKCAIMQLVRNTVYSVIGRPFNYLACPVRRDLCALGKSSSMGDSMTDERRWRERISCLRCVTLPFEKTSSSTRVAWTTDICLVTAGANWSRDATNWIA